MLGLLEKHCPVCGIDVNKNIAPKRFGKYFCSEVHSGQYVKMQAEGQSKDNKRHSGGGCC